MRDELKQMKPWNNENVIVNLDSSRGRGTHWVAFSKKGSRSLFYDSFGDLEPPLEVRRYLSGSKIMYNFTPEQKINTSICGHLCLKFLIKASKM